MAFEGHNSDLRTKFSSIRFDLRRLSPSNASKSTFTFVISLFDYILNIGTMAVDVMVPFGAFGLFCPLQTFLLTVAVLAPPLLLVLRAP